MACDNDPQVRYFGTHVETACAPNPWANTAGVNVQSCIVDWPTTPWQPWVNPHAPTLAPHVAPTQHTHYHFTPAPLSDADVERIAKRLAELLREPKP